MNCEVNSIMGNRWQEIWNQRTDRLAEISPEDKESVFMELKRCDGFDVMSGGGMPYSAFVEQYKQTMEGLELKNGDSVFEVGCGAGANLFLFKQDGLKVGGLDYAEAMIRIMAKVFKPGEMEECLCAEAADLPVDIKYDAVYANSVFSYFPDYAYAECVLTKMLTKARHSVGLLDVHDIEKQEAYEAYRISNVKDYKMRYEGLGKLFYPRKFFEDIAQKHGMAIRFDESTIEGYWNNPFIYHVFLVRER